MIFFRLVGVSFGDARDSWDYHFSSTGDGHKFQPHLFIA